jgi:hypothetical protein
MPHVVLRFGFGGVSEVVREQGRERRGTHVLEVDFSLPSHVDGGSQICGADYKVVCFFSDGIEDETRRLPRGGRLLRKRAGN